MKGYTIGLDLHQSFIQVVVFDEKGDDVESKRIRFQREALEKLIGEWKAWAAQEGTFSREQAKRFGVGESSAKRKLEQRCSSRGIADAVKEGTTGKKTEVGRKAASPWVP